jgi:hypothetical protein
MSFPSPPGLMTRGWREAPDEGPRGAIELDACRSRPPALVAANPHPAGFAGHLLPEGEGDTRELKMDECDRPPAEDAGYKVGRCRPPLATRFRPGQSGNPGGRPKRGVGAIVTRALRERVEAKENGRRRRITKLEAAVKQLVNRAANGDQRATQFVFALMLEDHGPLAPQAARPIGEADAMVVAELVRRLKAP